MKLNLPLNSEDWGLPHLQDKINTLLKQNLFNVQVEKNINDERQGFFSYFSHQLIDIIIHVYHFYHMYIYIEVGISNWQNIPMTVEWNQWLIHTPRGHAIVSIIIWVSVLSGVSKKMSGTHVLYFEKETLFNFLSITFTSSSSGFANTPNLAYFTPTLFR